MKKYLLLLLAVSASLWVLAADNYYGLEEIRDQWKSRNIKVPNGGQSPDIVKLLTAFQNVWGTHEVDPVLKCAKDPRFTRMRKEEWNEEIIVDRKNGYVCLDNGGADSGYMEACMWRRDTGHRLFAIRLGQPVDPEIEFVCFYDYDPKTSTLYPETGPEQEFRPLNKDNYISYNLPRKGKDFIIIEYDSNFQSNINHVYTWDGNKHHFSHISIDLKYGMRWFNPKETDYLVEMTKIAIITLPGQADHFYLLSDDEEEGMMVLALYKGDLELIGINDPISAHQLIIYPDVVVTKSDVMFQYTSYAFLKDSYVWQMITEYPTVVSQKGAPKITVEGWEDIDEEAARKKINSLGQPIQLKPEWREVRISDSEDEL